MGRFSVDLLLANNRDVMKAQEGSLAPENVRKVECKGVVDPGATRLVLPEAVANQLGLASAGEFTMPSSWMTCRSVAYQSRTTSASAAFEQTMMQTAVSNT